MRRFICALWSPAGKWLTSWLSFVVSNCVFVTFPLAYLIVSIPDICTLAYCSGPKPLNEEKKTTKQIFFEAPRTHQATSLNKGGVRDWVWEGVMSM